MSNMNKDQLIAKLVHNLTSLEIDSRQGKQIAQKVKYTLTYEKCTSTSEQEVNDSLNGLVDKFTIKGHKQLANTLLDHKQKFLDNSHPLGSINTNQSILKYDMLRLLQCLSSSSNQSYDHTTTTREKTQQDEITWEDVIREDPLEGDHWKTWPEESSNDDYSDDDGYEFEEVTTTSATSAANLRRNHDIMSETNVHTINYAEQIDVDNRGDSDALGYMITQQYWRDDFSMEKENTLENNLLQNPCQLCDAIGDIYYRESERRQMKTVTESDITREVISLLRGYKGVLFKYVDNRFQLNNHYLVQHLSQRALASLLDEFCVYGNMISELKHLVKHVANDLKYGQTSQAFASTIHKSLMDFEGQLSEIESDTTLITQNPTLSISILRVRNTLDSSFQCFKAIHEIAINIPFSDSNSRFISAYLISTFYDHALISQSSGQLTMYDTLLYVLEQIIIPYGQIIDEWVFYGSLTGDKLNEFYVSRNDDVPRDSPNFWIDGYKLEPMSLDHVCFPCPLFDKDVMSKIFFMGKTVNLLSQVEKAMKNVKLPEITPMPFSTVMKEFLSTKPPFINYNKSVLLQSLSPNITDPLTNALFPLKNIESMRISNNSSDSINDDDLGTLFDQSFMHFTEKYTEEPYNYTADTLNSVLHNQCKLSEQLNSLSSIYLMLENDLMHSFCEALFEQMDANEPWFDERMMSSTFSEACETSGYNETVYIKLKNAVAEYGVFRSPTAASYLELIDFIVEIPWPLNNFIKKSELSNYSKIISLLLRLKRAKYVIEKKTLFRGRQGCKKSDLHAMRFYFLRMKILWFINAFYRYIMTTILHAETIDFRYKLSISKDADDITALHTFYVRKIVDRCLLNNKSSGIKKAVINIFDLAEQMASLFVQYMQLPNNDESSEPKDLERFSSVMNNIEKDFNRLNEFVSISLMILGKKGNLPWFESLAASLSSQ